MASQSMNESINKFVSLLNNHLIKIFANKLINQSAHNIGSNSHGLICEISQTVE